MIGIAGQVNLYGFRRLTASEDRGCYYHELFLRGRHDLIKQMMRIRIKGTGCKFKSSPATEPNFYSYPPCTEQGPSCHHDETVVSGGGNEEGPMRENTCLDQGPENPFVDGEHRVRLDSPRPMGAEATVALDVGDKSGRDATKLHLEPPLSVKAVMRLTAPQHQHPNSSDEFAQQNDVNGSSHSSPVRPLPAPRGLPNFQNVQPLPRHQHDHTEVSLDALQHLRPECAPSQASVAKEGHETTLPDPFDDKVAKLFDEPSSTNTPLSLEDLMKFFVNPMIVQNAVQL